MNGHHFSLTVTFAVTNARSGSSKIQAKSRTTMRNPLAFLLLRFGAGEEGFEAYTQRQFVTESNNINSLEDHHIWSTINTLRATLPEFCSMDGGPLTGVTGAVS